MRSSEKTAFARAQEMAIILGDDWIPCAEYDYDSGDYVSVVQNKHVPEIEVRKTDLCGFFVKIWIPYSKDIKSVVQNFSQKMKIFLENTTDNK